MIAKTTSNKELVARCQLNDDVEAFGELYTRFFEITKCRLKLATSASEHDAKDIVQKAFIKAMHKIKSFRNGCEFGTWIYRISYNAFLDLVRSQRNLTSLEIEGVDGDSTIERAETTVLTNPRSIIIRQDYLNEVSSKIEGAMEKLTPNQRQIFEMIFVEKLSYQEVSDKIKCPIGTVMSRVHFTRKKLQDILGKELAII